MKSNIHRLAPVFAVADVSQAIDWYGNALGFSPMFLSESKSDKPEGLCMYALQENEGTEKHLCKVQENDETLSSASNCYLYVDDIRELHTHLLAMHINVTDLSELP